MNYNFAKRMEQVKPSAIRELLKNGSDSNIINFGGGYPDPEIFPIEKLQTIYNYTLKNDGKKALQYAQTDGLPELRSKIIERMTRRGINCQLENLILVQGAQQGIDLFSKMMLEEGDVVLCENPSYLGALQAFQSFQAKNIGVDMDSDGMKMDDLEKALQENPSTKFIYTIPDFQNPTGVTMSLDRRKKMVELAEKYDVLILEDNPYGEIRYEGTPITSIKSFDTSGRVVHLGTFSKILCPGMRLGWLIADKTLADKVCHLKMTSDVQNSTINMYAVNNFLDMFDVDAHIATLQAAYKAKKNLMVSIMDAKFPKSITYTNPEGGLFTWLTFPENVDAKEVMKRAISEAKIAFVPGEPFFATSKKLNTCRLSYSAMSLEKIEYGINSLADILNDMDM
jgi:2-aminoadipate transaminase